MVVASANQHQHRFTVTKPISVRFTESCLMHLMWETPDRCTAVTLMLCVDLAARVSVYACVCMRVRVCDVVACQTSVGLLPVVPEGQLDTRCA
eukprot:5553489-Amphidinium_carterae.1